jgi:hypothetical protein
LKKQPALVYPFDNIGASSRPMVALSGFYESHRPPTSGDARGIFRRIAMAIETASKVGRFVDCHPGGHQGNTE